jgi:hypothetical protein
MSTAYLKMDESIGIGTNMAAMQQQHSMTMTMAAIAIFFFMVCYLRVSKG